jgi:NADPH:quinone reductase-like Zn-dependent oxidoreductase
MKAIVYEKYGSPDVLALKEVAKPVPKDHEVLVKIQATSLNAADWRLLRADPFLARFNSGLLKPKHQILGSDIAGTVQAVGKNVTQFKIGDAVFGNLFETGFGGLAEFVCTLENALVLKPANLSFEEAAAIPMAAITALQALRDLGQIQAGQEVLINGASGGVGTFAVQIAKVFGALVTAVCSTKNLELIRSLGADQVIDYSQQDFTKNGRHYDAILAVNGFQPISRYQKSLSPFGRYVMVGGSSAQIFQALLQGSWRSMTSQQKMGALTLNPKTKQRDLVFVKELIETRTVRVVIDKIYPLNEAVQAFEYLETGHAKGKIVIAIGTHI